MNKDHYFLRNALPKHVLQRCIIEYFLIAGISNHIYVTTCFVRVYVCMRAPVCVCVNCV